MQSTSSTKLSLCACSAGTATTHDAESTEKHRTTIILVGIVLLLSTLALFCSAFTVTPYTEVVVDCTIDSSASSEASSALLTFAMGWFVCYVVMHRHRLAQKINEAVHCTKLYLSSTYSALANVTYAVAWFGRRGRTLTTWICSEMRRHACIIFVGILCLSCIIGLFVSAFTSVPDAEDCGDDGIASDSSQTMKAFTAGWIFVLSLKLRHELTGHLGSSCLLQPF